jgi:DNA-binding transcriptional MerR regulator
MVGMRIGDVARRSGVSARMLRHYESLGLIEPTGRTGVGYREYSEEDIRRIFHIESLRSLGLSLRDVGRALDNPGFAPAELVAGLVRQTRERIARETELLTRLQRIDDAEPGDWEDVLQVVALLQALGSESAGRRQRAALAAAGPVPMPVDALVAAALSEPDPNVAGALRWALAQAGDDVPRRLARGLASEDPGVRERAVRSIAGISTDEATALLRDCLTSPDVVVRRRAALALATRGAALGSRGLTDVIPVLIDMIVDEENDVDAADALSALAADPGLTEHIAAGLVTRLADSGAGSPARRRLTQALADIPGGTTSKALAALSEDDDRGVAVTATYLLKLRAD